MAERTGSYRLWLVSRDSVGGAWHEAVQLTDFDCRTPVWARDGSGVLCQAEGGNLVFVSPQGRVLRRLNLVPTSGLADFAWPRYARDGRTIYVSGVHRDGRSGVWAIPAMGGQARLVVVEDDPVLSLSVSTAPPVSVGPDRIYLTVAQYESDIWVASLHW
jgi:hypothetical protein